MKTNEFKANILPESTNHEGQGKGCREGVRIIDPEAELAIFLNRCGIYSDDDVLDFAGTRRMDAQGKRIRRLMEAV